MIFNQDNVQPPVNVKIPEFVPKGSEIAYTLLMREIAKGKDAKIFNYIDPDIDGLYAGLMVEQYFKKLGLVNRNYLQFVNSNRSHGFKLDDKALKMLKGYLLIVTDFTVERDDILRILKAGINLIIIDHHEIDKDSYYKTNEDYLCGTYNEGDIHTGFVILNNQYKAEPQEFKFLSGAGMVYYFLKYVESKINVPLSKNTPAQVGITLLSDIRDIDNWNARQFLKYTFNVDSDYMKYLHWLVSSEKASSQRFTPFGVPKTTRDFIDYTLSPIINALLRANLGFDALALLRGEDESKINEYKCNDRILTYRNKQKEIIKQILDKHKELENVPNSFNKTYSTMKVCCIPSNWSPTGYLDVNITNYIGVACSKIKDEDKTGVIFVVDTETNEVIRGSVRGGKEGIDYLEIFRRNNIPSAGHHNAFGILKCNVAEIDFDKLNADIEETEKNFLSLNVGNTRSVFSTNKLDVFLKSPTVKDIALYNEYSRDNSRIYINYTGNLNNPEVFRPEKVSDKYIKYYIDGVCVHCYDPSIDIEDALILIGMDNNKYIKCTLRPGFDWSNQDNSVLAKKLASIKNL